MQLLINNKERCCDKNVSIIINEFLFNVFDQMSQQCVIKFTSPLF